MEPGAAEVDSAWRLPGDGYSRSCGIHQGTSLEEVSVVVLMPLSGLHRRDPIFEHWQETWPSLALLRMMLLRTEKASRNTQHFRSAPVLCEPFCSFPYSLPCEFAVAAATSTAFCSISRPAEGKGYALTTSPAACLLCCPMGDRVGRAFMVKRLVNPARESELLEMWLALWGGERELSGSPPFCWLAPRKAYAMVLSNAWDKSMQCSPSSSHAPSRLTLNRASRPGTWLPERANRGCTAPKECGMR